MEGQVFKPLVKPSCPRSSLAWCGERNFAQEDSSKPAGPFIPSPSSFPFFPTSLHLPLPSPPSSLHLHHLTARPHTIYSFPSFPTTLLFPLPPPPLALPPSFLQMKRCKSDELPLDEEYGVMAGTDAGLRQQGDAAPSEAACPLLSLPSSSRNSKTQDLKVLYAADDFFKL